MDVLTVRRQRRGMASLHISHGVDDFHGWLATFNSFAGFREQGGVTAGTVRHAVDDPNFVTIDLDFASVEQTRAFLGRLESEVWPSAPHLRGRPTTHILEAVDATV
jgi:hypothetical protein